jgi:uncharacterized protein (TIGR03067 family)
MRFTVLVFLIMSGLVLGAGSPQKKEIKQEMDRFQGTWAPQSSVTEGKAAAKEELAVLRLLIKGDRWSYSIGGGPSVFQPEPTFSVNPNVSPKTLDVISVKQKGKNLLRAIYELKGDSLTICFAVGDAERPKEFKSSAGSRCGVTIYKRVK